MKVYKKYYLIPAPPDQVYLALTTASTLLLWTGEPAQMVAEPTTEFSLWDGSIVGRNLEFEAGKKIVQHWYFGDQAIDSIVTIKLHPHKVGTSAELIHTNIPDEDYTNIVEGWNESYFGSLIEFYED
jgi:activator of HSP90 ATPase